MYSTLVEFMHWNSHRTTGHTVNASKTKKTHDENTKYKVSRLHAHAERGSVNQLSRESSGSDPGRLPATASSKQPILLTSLLVSKTRIAVSSQSMVTLQQSYTLELRPSANTCLFPVPTTESVVHSLRLLAGVFDVTPAPVKRNGASIL